jgi:hypothetical protein
MFADLYDHAWAVVTYGILTAGLVALFVGFGASIPWTLALGGGLRVITGVLLAANLSVAPIQMFSNPWAQRVAEAASQGERGNPTASLFLDEDALSSAVGVSPSRAPREPERLRRNHWRHSPRPLPS